MKYDQIVLSKALGPKALMSKIRKCGFTVCEKKTQEYWGWRRLSQGQELKILDQNGDKFAPGKSYSVIRIQSDGELPDWIVEFVKKQFA